MRRTKTLTSLVAALVLALTLGGYAYANPLDFESDLSEDGVINVCNPNGLRDGRVTTAIKQWNAVSAQWGGTPTLRDVSGKGASCEVRVEEWSGGGGLADFYARVEFREHPDKLQISRRFTELPVEQRQAVITHEFGHVLGLEHPPADEWTCANSVMTTITECSAVAGVERRSTPGANDEWDLQYYWVEELRYPVRDKCWDSACTNWGPPGASKFGPSSRDGGGGGDRKAGTGGPPSAVQPPRATND